MTTESTSRLYHCGIYVTHLFLRWWIVKALSEEQTCDAALYMVDIPILEKSRTRKYRVWIQKMLYFRHTHSSWTITILSKEFIHVDICFSTIFDMD